MSATVWSARERICGRRIEVVIDLAGALIAPASCPHCGRSPVVVDLVEQLAEDVGRILGPGDAAPPAGPLATTAAVELARLHGIDLAEVVGTGANGAIIMSDVRRAIDQVADAAGQPRGDADAEGGSAGSGADAGEQPSAPDAQIEPGGES